MADPPNVSGVQDTLDALLEFPKATGQNVVRRALIKAAAPMVEAAKAYAPNDPATPAPDLVSSIVASDRLTRRARKGHAKENEIEVFIGPATQAGRFTLSYAAFQEFGTVKQPPHPYLRPAFDRTKEAVMENFGKTLSVEYEKTALRLANRFFKRG